MKKLLLLSMGLFFLLAFNLKAEAATTNEIDVTDNLPASAFKASTIWHMDGNPNYYGPERAFDNVWDENNGGYQSGRDTILPQWIRVDIGQPQSITKIRYQADSSSDFAYDLKDFVVSASNDDNTWVDQYKGTALANTSKQEFSFQSTGSFRYWKITALNTISNKNVVIIGEMELLVSQSTPDPTPEPTPTTEEKAILVVTMTNGLEKEFDLSLQEVTDFINWYESKQAGNGRASYAIDKHNNNKGPFKSRKDYILFDRILTFEVSQY